MSLNRTTGWAAVVGAFAAGVIAAIVIAGCSSGSQQAGHAVTDTVLWVARGGNDAGPGTQAHPFATIQHAMDLATPGTTVTVRAGDYPERVTVKASGEPGHPVTLTAAAGERVVLDGSTLTVPHDRSAMLLIDSKSYVTIHGLEITGFRSHAFEHVPVGILVLGSGDHVRIEDNLIRDMGTTFKGSDGGDAHGIGVFGTSDHAPISHLEVVGNELRNLTLGSSEALVVNGNVTGFLIARNRVHDTNNIGIDAIGFEGEAPDPAVDQARDGVIRDNEVWNIDSYGNPAYGTDRSADGIYIDGGRDILVENNVVHAVNIGIELASEHHGRSTSGVTVRNNLVYDATAIGLAMGGYDTQRGSTQDCAFVRNTVVGTDGPTLLVQFDTRDNRITDNIFVAGPGASFVENPFRANRGNEFDHNLYWSVTGSPTGTWEWRRVDYGDFENWRAHSGNDARSRFADPLFTDPSHHDYSVPADSPATRMRVGYRPS